MGSSVVVVGTDLSESAAEAIRQAGVWAARDGVQLVVVHVAPDEIFRALETPRVADALADRVNGLLTGLNVEAEIVLGAGSPHATLVQVADQRSAALLVVGASGAGGVGRVLFGSTTAQVVRYAHCPVLVARTSPESGPVLAATDFSEPASAAVEAAAREAKRRGAPLHLVHCLYEPMSSLSLLGPMVITPPQIPVAENEELRQAAEETLRTLLRAAGVPGSFEVIVGPPGVAIADACQRTGAVLVVVGTSGRTGFARIALGSVAEAVASRAPCSALAVRRSASG